MGKVNVWALQPPKAEEATTDFGDGFVLTFRAMSIPEISRANELADHYVEQFMGIDSEGNVVGDAFPFPPIGDGTADVKLSRTMITNAVMMQCAQPDEQYDWQELIVIAVTLPDVFARMITAFGQIVSSANKKKRADNLDPNGDEVQS